MIVVAPEGAPPLDLGLDGMETLAPGEALALVEGGVLPHVVVVAPTLAEPVAFAQRLHALDRTIALVLVAEAEGVSALSQAVLVAPFLGPDVVCASLGDVELLAAEVADAAERSEQRRRFRATLSSASAQLAAAVGGTAQATRFVGKLLEDAPLAVVSATVDGDIASWNRRAAELFGRAERDVFGKPLEALFVEESRPRLRALVSEPTTPDGRPATAVLESELRDGRRFLRVTASVLPAGRGPASLLLMLQDETDRVVAEREREAARRELAFLVEAGAALAASPRFEETITVVAHVAVPSFADWCVVDIVEDGRIRRVASSARDAVLEAAVHELQRRYPPGWDSPQPAAIALRRRHAIRLDVDSERIRSLTVDDAHYELMLRIAPASVIAVPLIARGETIGVLTFVRGADAERYTERDVDLARRVAERAALALDNARLLATAEERARAARVLDAVGDGVFLVDRAGRVRLWNPAAERILRIAPGDVVGRRLTAVLPAWSAVAASIPVAAPGATPATATVPVDVAGSETWIAIAGVGTEEGTVYAFRDATEEVALERIRSEFVATVSHELRTPLSSVYGAALTLEREDIGDDDPVREQLTQVIVREAARLARIVDDILLASHLDAGGVQVERRGVDGDAVVRQAVESARASLSDPGRVALVHADRVEVVGDADRLRQVLGNLIDNALKYSAAGAPVEVELRALPRRARFSIRDRGVGIPPGEHARIFEKFYRLDPNQARGVGGTGLGLYISRELVRQMGGRIGLEGREGGGTCFFVELPLAA